MVGYAAGQSTSGTITYEGAVGIGYKALYALTSGAGSVVIGYEAGDAITSGDYNTAIGYQALSTEDTGDRNTAVGYGSLLNANGANNNANTALGFQSGTNVTTGTKNVLIGAGAGDALQAGVDNVIIGHDAEGNDTDAGNCIVIGAGATGVNHNSVTLGNADVTDVYMAQDSGATVHAASLLTSGNVSGSATSTGSFGRLSVGNSASTVQPKFRVADGVGSLPTMHPEQGDLAIFQNNASTSDISAIYTIAGTDGSSHYVFGDANTKNIGRVSYDHSSDAMTLHTNASEQMRINSSGNVGIGHSNPNVKLQVMGNTTISGSASGNLDFIVRNNHATALARAIVQNNNTDQNIIMFSDDANGYGSIGSSTGGSNNIRFKVGTDAYFEGGKFGINAVNPQFALHVSGSGFVGIASQSSGSGAGMFSDDINGRSYVLLDDAVSGHTGFGSGGDYTSLMRQNSKTTLIAYGTTQGFEIGTHGSDEIDFITNNTRRMTIEAGGDVEVVNALSKGSGTFRIPHPVPEKKDKLDLQHSFVESPTRGDNIYRWQVEVQNNQHIIELPDYYQYLNENDMVWVNPVNHFGRGYGNVNDEQTELTITTDTDGLYNVLLIGTRKDETAMNNFKGIEVERKEETFKGAEPLENKTK